MNDNKYFLLHDFIYGWDVSHFEENERNISHVVLMDSIEEAKGELEDVKHEADLWKIEEGFLDLKTNKIVAANGKQYDYEQQ